MNKTQDGAYVSHQKFLLRKKSAAAPETPC